MKTSRPQTEDHVANLGWEARRNLDVHLDHAGASGHLAGLLPNAVFYVYVIGYRHLVDPMKLVEGATRVVGDDLLATGELPVPQAGNAGRPWR